MKSEEPTNIFRIDISKAEFEKLRKNPKFALILQLARYANQINYIWNSAPESGTKIDHENDPTAIREMFNRILFAAGIMHEMLKMVSHLGKEFRHFPSYQDGFAKWSKNKNTRFLKEKILNKMRNQVAYHVDIEPIEETLSHVDFKEIVFFKMDVNDRYSMHWQLADDIAFNVVTGKHDTDEDQARMYGDMLGKFADLIAEFNESSQKLIFEYARRKGWKTTSQA